MATHAEFFEKWERNKTFVNDFIERWENHLNVTDTWDKRAFFDSDATCRQFLDSLKQVSSVEYSFIQKNYLQNLNIHLDALPDYMKNLDVQYDNLKILSDSLN